VAPGRAVAVLATLGSRQSCHHPEYRAFYLLNHKLGNPVAAPELDRVLGIGVQQNHLDLATVPRVYCARRIDDRHAVASGKA
jgi:hypothetical protein